jgi:hypothetical protein
MLRAYQGIIATIGAGLLWALPAGAAGDALSADKVVNEEDILFTGQFLWAASTTNRGCYQLLMQSDGNLVTYNQNNFALWASHTVGTGGYARMQTDGNFDVARWATNTLTTGRLNTVIQQTDGNLVVYRKLGPNGTDLQAAWASGIVVSDPHTMLCPGSQKMHVSYNNDASGSDYSVFNPQQARSSWCGYYCATDPSCVSYTYAPPGTEQGQAVCHLKNGFPSKTPATGFVYGYKTAG